MIVNSRILPIENSEGVFDGTERPTGTRPDKGASDGKLAKVWREGVAPLLSTEGLEALRQALARTTRGCCRGRRRRRRRCSACRTGRSRRPVPWATAAGRATGWRRSAEVEEFFARMCFEIDQRLGEPAGCRWFLNWFDETPRDEMRRLLLAEVMRALTERRVADQDDFAFETNEGVAAA